MKARFVSRQLRDRVGFKFMESGVEYHAETVEELVSKIGTARLAGSGDLLPDWQDRLLGELHASYPWAIDKVNRPRRGLSGVGSTSAMAFLSVASRHLKNGGKFVDQETARMRADTCLRCPVRINLTACALCKQTVAGLLFKVPERFDFGDRSFCQACGCSLPEKVWLLDHVLAGDPRHIEYWSECWVTQPPAPDSRTEPECRVGT